MNLWRLNNYKKLISFIVLLICFSSCQKESEFISAARQMSVATIDDDRNALLIIPNEGCGGCISGATYYAKENLETLEQRSTTVIFTGVKDRKLFKNQVGIEFLTEYSVLVDSSDLFMKSSISSIYPQLVRISKGKVIDVTNFDPSLEVNDLNDILSF